jgi:membrane-bound lytic murein transglycosylase D
MKLNRPKKYFFIFFFLICFVFLFYIARAQEEALFQERVEVFEPLPEELIKHLPSDINQQIAYFVKYFSTEKREVTERWFRRCGPFLPYFKMIFKEEGLPEDLV